MIKVLVMDDWHELDTLNGYYRLDDLHTNVGRPEGLSPRDFVEATKPHTIDTIQIRKHVWASQAKVYEYAAFIDPAFRAVRDEAMSDLDNIRVDLFKTVATGVTAGIV